MRSNEDRPREARAFAASVVLHLVTAPLIVVTTASTLGVWTPHATSAERVRVTLLSLDAAPKHAVRTAFSSARAATAARPVARAAATRKPAAERTSASPPSPAPAARPQRPAAAALRIPTVAATHGGPPPAVVAVRPLPADLPAPATPVPTPTATPPATPSPSPTTAVVARGVDIPNGGWGETFSKPLVADESALDDARARMRAHGSARVAVDDVGRALSVTFSRDVPADARGELERVLLGLRYVPAECNGLRCAGTIDIVI
jgi:hypothetical protein